MSTHVLETEVWLPSPVRNVFPFFADAANLGEITPPWLHFQIRTPLPIDMCEGARIEYRIRLHGIPLSWRTLISEWQPPYRFVDEQTSGPYRRWHHTHTFEEINGGTMCRDRVIYEAPGGGPVNRWFVRPRVERIFAYRRGVLLARFCPGNHGSEGAASGNEATKASHSATTSPIAARS